MYQCRVGFRHLDISNTRQLFNYKHRPYIAHRNYTTQIHEQNNPSNQIFNKIYKVDCTCHDLKSTNTDTVHDTSTHRHIDTSNN